MKRTQKKDANKPKLLELECVLGTTATHQRLVAAARDVVVYASGATVVAYSPSQNRQLTHLTAPSHKTILSLTLSRDGRFVAVGEQGHQPAAVVWDLTTRTIAAELKSHKFGVQALAFAPNGRQLVTVGAQHDGSVVLWDWRNATVLACSKLSVPLQDIAWAPDGSCFVTSGLRHLKWWFVSAPGPTGKCTIESKTAHMQAYRDACFSAVACTNGLVYTLTTRGMLCSWNQATRELDKWVDIKMRGLTLSCNDSVVCAGGCDGVVRQFRLGSLDYVCTLPRPHGLGRECAAVLDQDATGTVFPDVVAARWVGDSPLVCCMYSDRSLYVWDVTEPKAARKLSSHLWHTGTIWDLDIMPPADGAAAIEAAEATAADAQLAAGAFASVGADGTLRVWNLGGDEHHRNAYSHEMIYCVRYSDDYSCSKISADDMESGAATATATVTAGASSTTGTGSFSAGASSSSASASSSSSTPSLDVGAGVAIRALRVSPDGRYIATGDRAGNLRVHDTTDMRVVSNQQAHDAEILSLDYSWPTGSDSDRLLLASASRDRLIHIFDASVPEHPPVCSLDEHSATITTVRFMDDGTGSESSARLMSCGADKSVLFRSIQPGPEGLQITRYHQAQGSFGTMYDMDVDGVDGCGVVAGQDRRLSVYDVDSGRVLRQVKLEQESGEVLRVQLDPSARFVAVACSDRGVRIVDYAQTLSAGGGGGQMVTTVEPVALLYGHSEAVTAVRWSHDCRRLLTVSVDGCIFVWRVDAALAMQLQQRAAARLFAQQQQHQQLRTGETAADDADAAVAAGEGLVDVTNNNHHHNNNTNALSCPPPTSGDDSFTLDDEFAGGAKTPDLAFSVTGLPSWAKNVAGGGAENAGPMAELLASVQGTAKKRSAVRGRWAQRTATADLPVFSALLMSPGKENALGSLNEMTSPLSSTKSPIKTTATAFAPEPVELPSFVDDCENTATLSEQEQQQPTHFLADAAENADVCYSNPMRQSLSAAAVALKTENKAPMNTNSATGNASTTTATTATMTNATTTSGGNKSAVPTPLGRKEAVAAEVARTRERLARLGLVKKPSAGAVVTATATAVATPAPKAAEETNETKSASESAASAPVVAVVDAVAEAAPLEEAPVTAVGEKATEVVAAAAPVVEETPTLVEAAVGSETDAGAEDMTSTLSSASAESQSITPVATDDATAIAQPSAEAETPSSDAEEADEATMTMTTTTTTTTTNTTNTTTSTAPSSPLSSTVVAEPAVVEQSQATTETDLAEAAPSSSLVAAAEQLEAQLDAFFVAFSASDDSAAQAAVLPVLQRVHAKLDSVDGVGHAQLLEAYSERLLAAVLARKQ